MTLPNILTTVRIFSSPLFILFFLLPHPWCKAMALFIAVYAEVSDLLDGYLARKYHCVSETGKLLDPFSDSVFHFSVFLSFLTLGYASLWMIVAIFYRESFILWLRWVGLQQKRVIAARAMGKIKTAMQGTVVIFVALLSLVACWVPMPIDFQKLVWWLMCVITVVTVVSLIEYIWVNADLLKAIVGNRPVQQQTTNS